ncbi:MAG: AMP-binding protein, partial [Pseudomonadota bacterium]
MSLWSRLEEIAGTHPDKVAITAPDASLTYAGLCAAAEEAEIRLAERGVGPGDRVAYLGFNTAALLVLIFAAARGGFMIAPLNWRLAEEELAWIIDQAELGVLVADAAHGEIAPRVAGACAILDAASLSGGGPPAHPHLPKGTRPVAGDGASPVLLVYTSGATGRPKGAVLSQNAVMANACLSWDMHEMGPEDHVLTALPMFHVGGLNIQTLPALLTGASVTLMDRFEPGACLAMLAERRATLTVQVPATLQALMAHPDWERADLSALRAIATGSTDVPVPLIRAVHTRGVPVIQIYGATETGPVVIYQRIADARSHIGSIGRAGPGVAVQITAQDGTRVAEGRPGEIWLRSPTLACEYWRNPEANSAFAGGWFRTGDVARRDQDGFLWFTDRKKNVIISGGENIYPAELERVLRDVPGVTEAAVAGRPDPAWGAVPVAAVVGEVGRDAILGAWQ